MEQVRKHSRKRDAILRCVRSTDCHPTAEWVFSRLKPEIPDLSLGTVYRNLAMFKEEGTILSLGVVHGLERFDRRVDPHCHLACQRCSRVLDVEDESLTIKITLNPGHRMNYHSHARRDEVWTVISGRGYAIVDGVKITVQAGDVVKMPAGSRHTIVADTELKVMEVQLGRDISVHDKEKFPFPEV